MPADVAPQKTRSQATIKAAFQGLVCSSSQFLEHNYAIKQLIETFMFLKSFDVSAIFS
jgi:hypothetical protein